ncbi:DHHW family protein [Anaerosalibacter bizertensis]|uniref:DHHW family protein n=1 Tax=Anaerosalibacter bizertensis TaxID=932217 RepID=UPI0035111029
MSFFLRRMSIYYKTDHHWTSKGAFYAYKRLGESMGFYPHGNDYFDIKEVTDSFYGSLYSKGRFRNIKGDSIELYIPKKSENCTVEYYDEKKISNSLYNMESLKEKDKYTVFLNGNHSLLKINTDISNSKKLLIIKDSYANSLVPFLTGHYNEIYMIDLRYFNEDLSKFIKENNIDDTLILYNVKTFFEDNSIEKISW